MKTDFVNSNAKTRRALACAMALLLACLMALVLAPGRATAAPADDAEGAVETVTTQRGAGLHLGRDYVWTGEDLQLEGTTIDNDLLFAGKNLTAKGLKVAGSIRAAGQNINVGDATVTENISVAGQKLSIDGGTANDVSMAGETVKFAGTANSLHMYGNEVIIDGAVNGDVTVGANVVEIGPNANIKGTLRIDASAEPAIPASAHVGDMQFTLDSGNSWAMFGSTDVSAVLDGFGNLLGVMGTLITIIGTLLVALFSELFFRRQTAEAGQMLRLRTGKMIITGIIGTLLIPIAIGILFLLIITIPVAGALALGILGLACVSTGFIGAALARMLPKMNRFVAALVGGLVLGLLCLVPVLGTIIPIICFVLMIGYILQRIFMSMKGIELEDPTAGEPETVGF
ncbi:MAG: hypothetical protein ACOYIP_06515 [Coriobacteriales bacterium]|jgi:cytoskeletal protein CcmA (bactofilin family)